MPKEYVVALVVEGDGAPATKLWLVVEQCAKHATHRQTQPSAKVIQDYLSSNKFINNFAEGIYNLPELRRSNMYYVCMWSNMYARSKIPCDNRDLMLRFRSWYV